MYQNGKLIIGKSAEGVETCLIPKMANRHGLITGATGTGKTVTLKVMAESFSDAGVPVFFADVKGDLAGCCAEGVINEKIAGRLENLGISTEEFITKKYPVNLWDVYGEKGMPLRTTVTEMGPILLGRVLGLTDNQADLLSIVFKIADDEELLLIDTKDLKAMLNFVGEYAKEYSMKYGNITKASLAVIIRSIVALEAEGAEQFFGEPALSISDFMSRDCDGKGTIQILDCQKLVNNPTMYSTFLLWMMSELFEKLPEVGDLDRPKMVFFFDEAHLLFQNTSKDLLLKIEQVVKLIRSKGVGIYFITQAPKDIPDGVLSQLGNKVQHALRAYTPADQKVVKAAAQSYRPNPLFDTYESIMALQTGEAIVSMLDENGVPTVCEKVTILPPQSQMGGISDDKRQQELNANLLYTKYSDYFDRDSAYEFLVRRDEELAAQAQQEAEALEEAKAQAEAEKQAAKEAAAAEKQAAKEAAAAAKQAEREAIAAKKAEEKKKAQQGKAVKTAAKGVASTTVGTIGRQVGKAAGSKFGSFGKTLGGNVGASLGRGIIGTLFKL